MQDLSDAYENGGYIPGGSEYPSRWVKAAQAFRAQHSVVELRGFHEGTRRAVDMVSLDRAPNGTMIFVHGGYWRAFDKNSWTHLAKGALARGWQVAFPGYDLCPNVRVADIARQIATAITAIAETTTGPVALTGHSAGGHLVARMLAPDVLPPETQKRIARAAPISLLSDLRPLMQTELNADLNLDAAEAATESPVLQPAPSQEVLLWVGGNERPAFLDQTRWLSEAWQVPHHIEADRHHFNVIETLEDEDSRLVRFLTGH